MRLAQYYLSSLLHLPVAQHQAETGIYQFAQSCLEFLFRQPHPHSVQIL
jgi:hypothetical protein